MSVCMCTLFMCIYASLQMHMRACNYAFVSVCGTAPNDRTLCLSQSPVLAAPGRPRSGPVSHPRCSWEAQARPSLPSSLLLGGPGRAQSPILSAPGSPRPGPVSHPHCSWEAQVGPSVLAEECLGVGLSNKGNSLSGPCDSLKFSSSPSLNPSGPLHLGLALSP